jgi:hypothetical protein
MSNQISNARIAKEMRVFIIPAFESERLEEECGVLVVTKTDKRIRFDLMWKDSYKFIDVDTVLPFEVDNVERAKVDLRNILENIKEDKYSSVDDNFGTGVRWTVGNTYAVGIVLRPKKREAVVAFPTENKQPEGGCARMVFCDYDCFIACFEGLLGQ